MSDAAGREREPTDAQIVDAQIMFCQQEDIAGTALIGEAVEFGFRAGWNARAPSGLAGRQQTTEQQQDLIYSGGALTVEAARNATPEGDAP